MLIKWIRCRVPAETREAFATAQRSWSALRGCPGFLGQIGGWRAGDGEEAVIAGLWRDADAHRVFMAEHHDEIVDATEQTRTYRSAAMAVLEERIRMPGRCPSLEDAVGRMAGGAGFLRAADCFVRPGRAEHFAHMQRTWWLPAMQEAEGMLAGAFAGEAASESRRLVVSLWTDEAAHARYVCEMLPGLRARAEVDLDLERIDAVYACLEPSWTVTASDG